MGIEKLIGWDNSVPAGKIEVVANPIEGNCFVIKELIINIKDTVAPPKSFPIFIDEERKLLACSDISSKVYRWLKVTNGEQIELGVTEKPYLIYEAGAQQGEVFYVETAYENKTCFTRSYSCSYDNDWNKSSRVPNMIYPTIDKSEVNFVVKKENISVVSNTNEKLNLRVVDLNGRQVYSTSFVIEQHVAKQIIGKGTFIFIVESEQRIIAKKKIGL
jgi:hypothetical protein